ncbi:hypothetical protein P3W45_000600 [Vairimorpha bombi]
MNVDNSENVLIRMTTDELMDTLMSKGMLKGEMNKCLVDTGAEVSPINYKLIRDKSKIRPFYGHISDEEGSRLDTVGILDKQLIGTKNTQIKFSLLVVRGKLEYIILDADTINNNKNFLKEFLGENVNNIKSTEYIAESKRAKNKFIPLRIVYRIIIIVRSLLCSYPSLYTRA